jgi:hypothetical protein
VAGGGSRNMMGVETTGQARGNTSFLGTGTHAQRSICIVRESLRNGNVPSVSTFPSPSFHVSSAHAPPANRGHTESSRAKSSGTDENVFSYRLKRLLLLMMIVDFQNGGKLPVCPQFPGGMLASSTANPEPQRKNATPIWRWPTSSEFKQQGTQNE